jgi:hypothetical protein
MVSESARVTTAKEAGYRIEYPNSRPRSAKLVALDGKSGPMVERLAQANRHRSVLLGASPPPGPQASAAGTVSSLKHWLSDFSGRIKALVDALDPADLVILVATAGEDTPLAAVIGEACRSRGVPVTALILAADEVPDDALSSSLTRLRPYASMLVVVREPDYVEDMLAALRV